MREFYTPCDPLFSYGVLIATRGDLLKNTRS